MPNGHCLQRYDDGSQRRLTIRNLPGWHPHTEHVVPSKLVRMGIWRTKTLTRFQALGPLGKPSKPR
jgi:hypothetical protein